MSAVSTLSAVSSVSLQSHHAYKELTLDEDAALRKLLSHAGMLSERVAELKFRKSTEGNLCYVYEVTEGDHRTFLKIADKSGARGGFFIKFLRRGDINEENAGTLRRHHVRWLVPLVNEKMGRDVVPNPLCLGEGVFEYRVPAQIDGSAVPEQFVGCVMSHWSAVEGSHPKLNNPDAKVHDPSSYHVDDIRLMAGLLRDFQTAASPVLKPLQEAGKLGELSHEQRRLSGLKEVMNAVLGAFGMDQNDLEKLGVDGTALQKLSSAAKEQSARLEDEVKKLSQELFSDDSHSLNEICEWFLERYPVGAPIKLNMAVTSQVDGAPFQEKVFQMEKGNLHPKEAVQLGRRISQLLVCREMVNDILNHDAEKVCALLKGLTSLIVRYERLEKFPMGIVHQDGHPQNFLMEEGLPAMLDPDDLSYDYAFSDLSNVYVHKIVRAYTAGSIDKEKAIELLNAVLIPEWVREHGPDILDLLVASLWNHAEDLAACFRLDRSVVDGLNLAVTLNSFLEQLESREKEDLVYREELFPSLEIAR